MVWKWQVAAVLALLAACSDTRNLPRVGDGSVVFEPGDAPAFRSSKDVRRSRGITNHANIFELNVTAAMDVNNVALIGVVRHAHDSGTLSRAGFGLEGFAMHSGRGTTADFRGVNGAVFIQGDGTIERAAGLYAGSLSRQSGSTGRVVDNYGIFVGEQVEGETNWALWTDGDAPSRFGGSVVLAAPPAPPPDTLLTNGSVAVWLDEATDVLLFRVRSSTGVLMSGRVPLARDTTR